LAMKSEARKSGVTRSTATLDIARTCWISSRPGYECQPRRRGFDSGSAVAV
jgi:hypothetical protein